MSTFITAEIGINHNGNLENAFKLIDTAISTGCDAVKFQKRTPELCVPKKLQNKIRETPWGEITYIDYRKKVEFGKDEFDKIDAYCKKNTILWFASPWDLDSNEFLNQYNLQYTKIASAMLTYEPLVTKIAKAGKYTFISIGMSTFEDIDKCVSIFNEYNCPFELMYTVSKYPCNPEMIDLKCIPMLSKKYNCKVGYSGHEVSAFNISLAAVAFGASSIERHITLDRSMFGSDQSASLEKTGLRLLVTSIRNLEKSIGSGERILSEDEMNEAKRLRWFEDV